MFYVYCLCLYVCKQLFKGFFETFTYCYIIILRKKSQLNICRKKIVLNWVIFAPVLAQIPGLFRSGNPLYEFLWSFVWSHESEYMAQKLICIVLEIHYKSFIQIFRDHQSIEVNQSNNNKYFNKKKLELTPKLGILPSNS